RTGSRSRSAWARTAPRTPAGSPWSRGRRASSGRRCSARSPASRSRWHSSSRWPGHVDARRRSPGWKGGWPSGTRRRARGRTTRRISPERNRPMHDASADRTAEPARRSGPGRRAKNVLPPLDDPNAWYLQPLASLDFETTGVDPRRDRILSFAALSDVGGDLIDMVNPRVPIPESSADIHGITASDLASSPVSAQALRPVLAWFADLRAGDALGLGAGRRSDSAADRPGRLRRLVRPDAAARRGRASWARAARLEPAAGGRSVRHRLGGRPRARRAAAAGGSGGPLRRAPRQGARRRARRAGGPRAGDRDGQDPPAGHRLEPDDAHGATALLDRGTDDGLEPTGPRDGPRAADPGRELAVRLTRLSDRAGGPSTGRPGRAA